MVNIASVGAIPRLKNPIALVHGLFGFDRIELAGLTVASYFPGVSDCLQDAGNRLLIPRLDPIGGIAHRAQQLKDFLLLHSQQEPVHIIAHSMGGLDSRYMIAKLGMEEHVLSLTTLGTPHRGSPFADLVVGGFRWAANKFAKIVLPVLQVVNSLGIPNEAFNDLTTSKCSVFNENVPSCGKVRCYSVAARINPSGLWASPEFVVPYGVVFAVEGDNDGVVSVASAKFGDGFEVWEGDHFSLVNWFHPVATNRYNRDPLPRFGPLIARLADMGF